MKILGRENLLVFITDDDADDRAFLTEALQGTGFKGNYCEFANGEELISHLSNSRRTKPDLVLLDLNMPVKDGYQTLKELRDNEQLDTIPVFVLTSSSKREDELQCLQLGCKKFMLKPLSMHGYRTIAEEIISFTDNPHAA